MLLKDSQIRSALSKPKQYRLKDGGGLNLLIKPNGSKLWHFRYKFSGKEKSLSIGPFPEVTLSHARKFRNEAKELLLKNIDPSAHKRQSRKLAEFEANNTFELLAREWHQHRASRWSPKYAANTLRRLELHIFPLIGNRPIGEILPLEVLDVVQRLEIQGKTDMSHRVLEIMNSVFRRALITRRIDRNPAEHLSSELLSHTVKHHPALAENDLAGFLNRLQSMTFRDEQSRLAMWLLMLTAVRQCELRYSKKSDFDLVRREWILRPEVTKMKREHIVSLSTQAVTVVQLLFDLRPESEWLVPSQRTKIHPVMSENTINQVIKRMGYEGRIVGHGFRSLFSTILNDHGFDSKIVDRQLAHVGRDKIEAAYNRAEYPKQRSEMMQWWGDFLDSKLPEDQRIHRPANHLGNSFSVESSYLSVAEPTFNLQLKGDDSPALGNPFGSLILSTISY